MLKRSIVVFCISLLVVVGWLSLQRHQATMPPQFLTITAGELDFMTPNTKSHIMLTSPNGSPVRTLYKDLPLILSAAQWSDDGEWLYYSTVDNLLGNEPEFSTQRVRFGEEVPEVLAQAYYGKIAPQTAHFAYMNEDNRLIVENNEHQMVFDDFEILSEFFWTPNGEWLIFLGQPVNAEMSENPQVYRLHYSGSPLEQLTDNTATKSVPFISADGQWIAVYEESMTSMDQQSVERQVVRLISLNGQPDRTVAVTDSVETMAWSMSGDYLAYIASIDGNATDSSLVVINQNDLTMQRFKIADSVENIGTLQTILWSATDDSIYFSLTTYDQSQVYRFDVQTKKQKLIYQTASNANGLVFIMLSWSPPIRETWHPQWLIISSVLLLAGLGIIQLRRRLFKSPTR